MSIHYTSMYSSDDSDSKYTRYNSDVEKKPSSAKKHVAEKRHRKASSSEDETIKEPSKRKHAASSSDDDVYNNEDLKKQRKRKKLEARTNAPRTNAPRTEDAKRKHEDKKQKAKKAKHEADDVPSHDEESETPKIKDKTKLLQFVNTAFKGETKEMYASEIGFDPASIRGILNTLMDEYRTCSDAMAMNDYIRCVLIVAEIWLHRKPFADEGEFHKCLQGITLPAIDKWDWPVLNIEGITAEVFNLCCQLIYTTLCPPSAYQVPFQEFISKQGTEHGLENLLPLTNQSKKRGQTMANSEAVHMGLSLAGNFCMPAKNVSRKAFDMVFTDVNTAKLSECFDGKPPIKIHCGSLKTMRTLGKIGTSILVLGGFAELQCLEANGLITVRVRALVSVKVGETAMCDVRFIDRLL